MTVERPEVQATTGQRRVSLGLAIFVIALFAAIGVGLGVMFPLRSTPVHHASSR